jgi:hypothetical protein
MTHTFKTKSTPRRNARRNWKRKVNRSWKHLKQQDPLAPPLPSDVELNSTYNISRYNLAFWEQHYHKNFDFTYTDPNSGFPSDHELARVKALLIRKHSHHE